MGCVCLDVGAQGHVDFERLCGAAVEHAEPVAGRGLEVCGAEQVAGLDDDFERVAEVVGELANLECDVFRDDRFAGSGSGQGFWLAHASSKAGWVERMGEGGCRVRCTRLAVGWYFVLLSTRFRGTAYRSRHALVRVLAEWMQWG